MRPADDIERLVKNTRAETSPETDEQILSAAQAALQSATPAQPNIWRIIMKNRITKFATAAVVIVTVLIVVNMLKGTPTWAIGQSVKVLENVQTITVSGKSNHIAPVGNFNLLLKRGAGNWDSLLARGESDDLVFIVNDNMWYEHTLGCSEIYANDMGDLSSFGANVWNEIINNAPWVIPISPTMFKAAKLLADDWQETYKVDDQTGRDCVFVTGTYKPLSISFWIVFDLESKLMIRAKYWTNYHHKGTPAIDIKKISYDEETPDEIFIPGKLAKVIKKEELEKRNLLFNQANQLASKKQYKKAIEIFLLVYEKYPQFIRTPLALQFAGECYNNLGQHKKAAKFFKKVIREYSVPKKVIADAYRLLGFSYMSVGENTKALKNFEMGLEFITQWDSEGWRLYRETYRKEVEEYIEKLKNK